MLLGTKTYVFARKVAEHFSKASSLNKLQQTGFAASARSADSAPSFLLELH